MWLWHPPASSGILQRDSFRPSGREGLSALLRLSPNGSLVGHRHHACRTPFRRQRFDIGQPDLIGPRVGAEGPMGAFIIRAIDQQPANAGCAHCAERDFLFALYHESVLWPGNEESDCLLEWVGIQHQRRCQREPSPVRINRRQITGQATWTSKSGMAHLFSETTLRTLQQWICSWSRPLASNCCMAS